jgi:hypothetical protein
MIVDVGVDPATGNPTYEFDISNQTGVNSSGDPTFPVITQESVANPGVIFDLTSLTLNFADSTSTVLGPAYFAGDADGLSYTGNSGIPAIFDGPVPIVSATIAGVFDTTAWTLFDSSTATVEPGFSATITDPLGPLQDQDFAIIYGTTVAAVSGTPEPSSWLLIAGGLVALFSFHRARSRRASQNI